MIDDIPSTVLVPSLVGQELEPPGPGPETLLALSPEDIGPAQQQLGTWCRAKVTAIRQELADVQTNLDLAKRHGWRTITLKGVVQRTRSRLTYYEKLLAAVEAGYLIVPNFPIDLFAVRVKRAIPRRQFGMYPNQVNRASPDLLPVGQGRYVDDTLYARDTSRTETVQGKETFVRSARSDGFDETLDFPITLVKPIILAATARALSLKIFDQLGIVGPTTLKGDPIVIGQILMPKAGWAPAKRVSFFVAWWLNVEDL